MDTGIMDYSVYNKKPLMKVYMKAVSLKKIFANIIFIGIWQTAIPILASD